MSRAMIQSVLKRLTELERHTKFILVFIDLQPSGMYEVRECSKYKTTTSVIASPDEYKPTENSEHVIIIDEMIALVNPLDELRKGGEQWEPISDMTPEERQHVISLNAQDAKTDATAFMLKMYSKYKGGCA